MNAKKQKILALAVIGFYIVFRMALDGFWRNHSEYLSYAFEALFVGAAILLYRKEIPRRCLKLPEFFMIFIPALFGGFLAYEGTTLLGIEVPFDFSSKEMIFLLLILSPLLEESIFRIALWEPLKIFTKKDWVIVTITSVIFAFAHMQALWAVPNDLRMFVLYQTAYVIILGLACGWARVWFQTVFAAILLHASFNLGFLLASKI